MKPCVIKQNVGNDISKDDFKVCFYQLFSDQKRRIKGSKTFKNTLSGFSAFIKWVEKNRVKDVEVRLTIEATGVYYEQLVHYLHDHSDYYISVVLPNMSKAYFRSLNLKSKTDKIDAKHLGLMGLERDLDSWSPASPNLHSLKQLTRDRVSLLEQKTASINRLHAVKHSYHGEKSVIRRLNQQIKFLEKQIKEVEKGIRNLIKKDEVLEAKVEKICTVKGLGITTVASIIAETNGFELFTSRGQLISYSGYDIVQKESGSSVKGKTRISKKGNKHIRRALHFPALVVVKHDQEFKQLFERLIERSHIKMKAYVGVQRKLLILIYTLYKKDEAYIPNYKDLKKIENQGQNMDELKKKKSKVVDRTQCLPTVDDRSRATSF